MPSDYVATPVSRGDDENRNTHSFHFLMQNIIKFGCSKLESFLFFGECVCHDERKGSCCLHINL